MLSTVDSAGICGPRALETEEEKLEDMIASIGSYSEVEVAIAIVGDERQCELRSTF